jgi:hypothetical protein
VADLKQEIITAINAELGRQAKETGAWFTEIKCGPEGSERYVECDGFINLDKLADAVILAAAGPYPSEIPKFEPPNKDIGGVIKGRKEKKRDV